MMTLKPGTPVLVREFGSIFSIGCVLDRIDAETLTCKPRKGGAEMVFAASSLVSIDIDRVHMHRWRRLTAEEIIGGVFGALFGTAAGIVGGPALMILGATGGAFVGVKLADAMHDVFTSP